MEFRAVKYKGKIYCTGCLPDGVRPGRKGVKPIWSTEKWEYVPVCCKCGHQHTYVSFVRYAGIFDDES